MAFGNDRAEADTALASWYGPGFHGQSTASGEIYNAYGYSAAHKTLPLGTELTVSYAGRSVDVVVNDRGPYSGGRDLDLSQGAAEYLGLTAAGVDYVDYEIAGSGGYAAADQYAAETGYAAEGAYTEHDSARHDSARHDSARHDSARQGSARQGSGAVAAAASYDDASGGRGALGGHAAAGGSYVVQSGDTLTGIAAELGTTVDQLVLDNGLTDPDVVYAGQTLAY
jgi:rare lipoprotein A